MNKLSDFLSLKSMEGYYWMSDSNIPIIIQEEKAKTKFLSLLKTIRDTTNPFIIEAQIYDKKSNLSYSLKYVDGKYIVVKYYVKENIEDIIKGKYDNISLKKYIANRMSGLKLLFLQYWQEDTDVISKEIPVLQPAEMVFVGFEINNKKKNESSL